MKKKQKNYFVLKRKTLITTARLVAKQRMVLNLLFNVRKFGVPTGSKIHKSQTKHLKQTEKTNKSK